MKVILISMPDVTRVLLHESALHMPILGVASVGANVDERHEVYVIDLVRKRGRIRKYLTRTLHRIQPDIIGLSAMTMQYDTCKKIMRMIKSIQPQAKIVLGGYHVTLEHDDIIQSAEAGLIDFIVRGEGEEVFAKLVDALEKGDGWQHIPSLTYKDNGVFRVNPRGKTVDLAQVKTPIRDKRRLTWGYHAVSYKIEVMETSRGCTRNCNFCSMRHMYGRTYRTYPIERVIAELDYIYHTLKTRVIFVADDNLVLNPKRVMAICDAIAARDYRNLHMSCQADCVTMARNEEMVRKMAAAGFTMIFLGIENGSSANLAKMNKGDIVKDSHKAVENCHKYGIAVVGGGIFGLPDDDRQSIKENYQFLKSLNVDSPYCQMITPYPKTAIREDLLREGLVSNPNDYKRYDGLWANVHTKHLKAEELQYWFWYYRQTVLGMWEPTAQYERHSSIWIWVWKYLAKPAIRYARNRQIKKLGWRKLYEKEMHRQEKRNVFKDLEDL